MDSIQELTQKIVAFRDARDWKQFHNPKDVAISLVLEATEVLEHFQWKSADDIAAHLRAHTDDVGDELADTLYWVLLMAHDLGIDLGAAFARKMGENEGKYPVEKARGKFGKYTEYTDV